MEQGAGDAGGDGQEVALSGEDFDLAGAGEFGEVDWASAADAGGGGFVGGDGRKLGEELAGMDEEGFEGSSFGCIRAGGGVERVQVVAGCGEGGRDCSTRARMRSHSLRMTEFAFRLRRMRQFSLRMTGGEWLDAADFDFLEGVGLADVEFGDGGAAERFEVGSAAEAQAHFVSYRTHVGSGGDVRSEVGAVALDGSDDEFLDFDLNGLQDDLLSLTGQIVGGDAFDFLGREWWRDLIDEAVECGSEFLQIVQAGGWTAGGGCPHMCF